MENKPFVVIQLNSCKNAHGDSVMKAFIANFKLLLVNPKTNKIKDWSFIITGDNYFALQQIDSIINNENISVDNPSLKKFQSAVKKLESKTPLKLLRKGDEYNWYLLQKFLEVYEGVSKYEENK